MSIPEMTTTLGSPSYDLFVFGDSQSDIGASSRATGGLVPPSPPYFNGRFSNGPVPVEFLAEDLGLGMNLRTNFAIGGATTGRDNSNNNLLPTPLQLGGVLDQIDRFQTQAATLGAGAEDLYVVWAGANDLLGLISQPANAPTVIATAVNNIANSVTTLASLGAKQIVVVQTPNLGRLPLSLAAGAFAPLTEVSTTFNTLLAVTLNGLEPTLGGANITVVDLFPLGEAIATNPAQFGFSETQRPFLNGLTPSDPNADPNTFFFWDRVHPTTRAYDLQADVLRDTIINNILDDISRTGTLQADRLVGYSGNDALNGRLSNDTLEGNPGNDTLSGNLGDDSLNGGLGDDLLLGGLGNDRLAGEVGDDRLSGGAGDDWLEGNRGDDVLDGGAGRDRLRGGPGVDTFVLNRLGVATVLDFQNGQDKLQLTQRLTFGQLQITQQGDNTQISINQTGNVLAILNGIQANTIGAADFV
jgi:phospholipase/lecithinase/hemolysin